MKKFTGRSRTTFGVFCAVTCEILFGFSFLFTKNVTQSTSPLILLSWRFLLAFAVLAVLAAAGVIRPRFAGKPVVKLLPLVLCHPILYFLGENYGVMYTTVSESGTLIACIPPVTLLLSALILKKHPTRFQILGVGISFVGVIWFAWQKGGELSHSAVGYALLAAAVLAYSLYCVFVALAPEFDSMEKTFVMTGAGAAGFTAAALIRAVSASAGEGGQVLEVWLTVPFREPGFAAAVLYLGLGSSVLAFFLSNSALDILGSNRNASFVGITTVVSVLSGVIFLKDPFTFPQLLATVLVLAGVYLANTPPRKRRREACR
jgi:drug/metabolite transporter (DMT)-like permease